MIEDKLTADQRLRLECLAQANAKASHTASAEGTLSIAAKFEKYVRNGAES